MSEAFGRTKKSGQKKLFFNGAVKVYLEKTWTISGFGYYAEAHDEKHFELWLERCHTTYSLKRGFGYDKKNMFTAVRLALKQLNENPDKSV
ncbi:MAG: hypothetical protein AABY22_25325 [Nanoarchaeota archaeon]